MKLSGLVRISLLISLVGSSALLFAQEREDTKPAQEETRPEASKPEKSENKAARQEEAKPSKQQEEAKPAQTEGRSDQPMRHDDHPAGAQQPMQHEQHANAQRGGHIPDDKFRAQFGRSHTVVINHTTIVEGQPRFQYSGYWFTIVDPWPAEWAYTDQCYIDYIDGEYFLFDLLHPGVRIALFVVM